MRCSDTRGHDELLQEQKSLNFRPFEQETHSQQTSLGGLQRVLCELGGSRAGLAAVMKLTFRTTYLRRDCLLNQAAETVSRGDPSAGFLAGDLSGCQFQDARLGRRFQKIVRATVGESA